MELEIIRVLRIAGRLDLARAAKEFNNRTPENPDATSMDIDGLENGIEALELLHRKLGSWEAVRAVVDAAIGTPAPSSAVPPAPTPSALDPELKAKLDRKVESVKMSVCLANSLLSADILYLGELVAKTEADLLTIRYSTRKMVKEAKKILAAMGLSLGMDVQGWTRPTK